MLVPKLFSLIVTFLAIACSTVLGYAVDPGTELQSPIDIYNPRELEEYAKALRRKHLYPRPAHPSNRTISNLAGRLQDPFAGISLRTRQTCTGNVDNYCFGDDTSFCSDCGLCCTQAAGGWCCITNGGSVAKNCCPADTGLADGQQGCCDTWQTCEQDTGCTDPT
jgi:hypothetical protein